ncbi:tigger transposable element-derived protein 1-like [Palaemon carinicauda]|uniref:tigger transposable element-derived protein 1-like n=1 Tax=Palaemon carinicauda TaxID=392227 RepID=UPI0035B5FBD6
MYEYIHSEKVFPISKIVHHLFVDSAPFRPPVQCYGGDTGESSTDPTTEEFKGSCGWFEKFKRWTGIHSVVRHREASSSDTKAANNFVKKFEKIVEDEGYIEQQVFNCDETGLFSKKMPSRTYITAEEKKMPGHKPMKDRLTLVLCANVSGDGKIKPLLFLLCWDNAPAHPQGLEDDIIDQFNFIRVLYLPPNTTPILQPVDQQAISDSKKLST